MSNLDPKLEEEKARLAKEEADRKAEIKDSANVHSTGPKKLA